MSTLSSPLAFVLLDLDSAGHSAAEDLLDDSGEGTGESLFYPYISNPFFFFNSRLFEAIFCALGKKYENIIPIFFIYHFDFLWQRYH